MATFQVVTKMQQMTEARREMYLRRFMKYRWWYACVWLANIAMQVIQVFHKHSQWPFLLRLSLPPGVSIWNSIWENLFGVVLFSFTLISQWVRIHNYRRNLLLAEQLALQEAAKPLEGVWPPPPTA